MGRSQRGSLPPMLTITGRWGSRSSELLVDELDVEAARRRESLCSPAFSLGASGADGDEQGGGSGAPDYSVARKSWADA